MLFRSHPQGQLHEQLKDDDENPDGIRHFQLFMELTLRVANSLTRVRTPNVVKVIR